MAKSETTLMAWLRRLLTADPSLLAVGSALSGPVVLLAVEERNAGTPPVAASKHDGKAAAGSCPRAPESGCAIPCPEPAAATAAPPAPVIGGLS